MSVSEVAFTTWIFMKQIVTGLFAAILRLLKPPWQELVSVCFIVYIRLKG